MLGESLGGLEGIWTRWRPPPRPAGLSGKGGDEAPDRRVTGAVLYSGCSAVALKSIFPFFLRHHETAGRSSDAAPVILSPVEIGMIASTRRPRNFLGGVD